MISKQFCQESHGERLCIVDQGGNVIARTPGSEPIDHFTADQIVSRWNAHNDLVAAAQAVLQEADADIYTDAPECAEQVEAVGVALSALRAALAKASV